MQNQTMNLGQVDEMQARLDAMHVEIARHHDDVNNASQALAEAHAEGDTDKAASLAESRRNARDMAQDLEAAAEVLAGRVVEARELAAANAARDRLDAIDREHSRKRAELTKDEKRVQDAAEALLHVVAQANKHYKDARKLENEAAVLAMRWPELGAPALNCGREVMERATVAASLSSLRRELEAGRIKCPGKPKTATMQANFTPEQKREAVLQGLAEYLDGRTSALYPSGGDPDSEGARLVMLAGLNPGEDKRAFCDQ